MTVFVKLPRKMLFLEFMMTSIEISSVNKLPGSCAWRALRWISVRRVMASIRLLSAVCSTRSRRSGADRTNRSGTA